MHFLSLLTAWWGTLAELKPGLVGLWLQSILLPQFALFLH